MFVGHFAVGLVLQRAAPRLGLPVLFVAVQFLDVLWPIFILIGVEHAAVVPGFAAASYLDLYDFPYSHSLVFSLLWSALFASPLWFQRRWRDGAVLAVCVFSHFILDLVSHRPDMPLWPGDSRRFGLGMWNSVPATLILEGALFLGACLIYARGTRALRPFGGWGFWSLAALLTAIWVSGIFGPPPPNIQLVAGSIVVTLPLIVAWVRAVDRARTRPTVEASSPVGA